jgi:hypothetical protein
MTVNELIEKLVKYRDENVINGAGDVVITGNSTVTMINHRAPDDYWITPVQTVDVDCFGGPWVVTLEVDDFYGKEASDRFDEWLDGKREDY